MPAWSASRLKTFRQCPKKYNHLYVKKDVREPKSEQMKHGDRLHKILERRVGGGQPLPKDFRDLERFAKPFDRFKGHVMTERQMAVNEDKQPTEWFASDVECRAIADVLAVAEDTLVVIDWKTGKWRRDDIEQIELTCAVALAHYPDVRLAKGALVYVAEEDPDRQMLQAQVNRDGLSRVWQQFAPTVERLSVAMRLDEWEPRPSKLCAWCPVKSCEFNPK